MARGGFLKISFERFGERLPDRGRRLPESARRG